MLIRHCPHSPVLPKNLPKVPQTSEAQMTYVVSDCNILHQNLGFFSFDAFYTSVHVTLTFDLLTLMLSSQLQVSWTVGRPSLSCVLSFLNYTHMQIIQASASVTWPYDLDMTLMFDFLNALFVVWGLLCRPSVIISRPFLCYHAFRLCALCGLVTLTFHLLTFIRSESISLLSNLHHSCICFAL